MPCSCSRSSAKGSPTSAIKGVFCRSLAFHGVAMACLARCALMQATVNVGVGSVRVRACVSGQSCRHVASTSQRSRFEAGSAAPTRGLHTRARHPWLARRVLQHCGAACQFAHPEGQSACCHRREIGLGWWQGQHGATRSVHVGTTNVANACPSRRSNFVTRLLLRLAQDIAEFWKLLFPEGPPAKRRKT